MGSTRAPSSSEEEEVEDEHSEEHHSNNDDTTTEVVHGNEEEAHEVHDEEDHHTTSLEDGGHTESAESLADEHVSHEEEEVPVEQRLRELTDDLGRLQQISSNDDETRQSFLSLSDLIKNLRQDDEKNPPLQIDSSYSRSKVLGEKPEIVYHPRNTGGDVANRSLFKK